MGERGEPQASRSAQVRSRTKDGSRSRRWRLRQDHGPGNSFERGAARLARRDPPEGVQVSNMLAFSVTLLRPQWLLVLLAAPLFVWLALRASRYRPRAGDWAALVARTILLAALALALSIARVETKSKCRAVAYASDLSESMPADPLRRAHELVRDGACLPVHDD